MGPPMPVSLLRSAIFSVGIVTLILSSGSMAAQARDGVNAAIIGGAAAGVVGGVVAGALLNEAHPAPGYAPPPPPPRPVYVQERPVVREVIEERPVVREVIVHDDARDRAFRLHEGCEAGDRHACVKLGMIIGQHQEQRAEWQRVHPEMFTWDR